jgi:hypothetical protein
MLATELLFVYVYCLVDDAINAGVLSIPRRPGPAPAGTDAELVTIALARHLLGRRSENGFLAEVRRDWPHLFPRLPGQPEVNRRTRWLRGAFEQLRAACAATVPPDPLQQIDTSALQRTTMPKTQQRLIARLRNRVETSFKEITDQMDLARHGAHTFEGLLTRTVATLAALTQLTDAA